MIFNSRFLKACDCSCFLSPFPRSLVLLVCPCPSFCAGISLLPRPRACAHVLVTCHGISPDVATFNAIVTEQLARHGEFDIAWQVSSATLELNGRIMPTHLPFSLSLSLSLSRSLALSLYRSRSRLRSRHVYPFCLIQIQ